PRRGRLARPSDEATFRLRGRGRHGLAGEQLLERFGEIAMLRLGPLVTDAVLVVDLPCVANHALIIEHNYFGGAFRAEAVGGRIAWVLQNGKRDAARLGVIADGARTVLLI